MLQINAYENPADIPSGLHASSLPEIASAAGLTENIAQPASPPVEVQSGWDAYEVWRRFIKDPRDRRRELKGKT